MVTMGRAFGKGLLTWSRGDPPPPCRPRAIPPSGTKGEVDGSPYLPSDAPFDAFFDARPDALSNAACDALCDACPDALALFGEGDDADDGDLANGFNDEDDDENIK